MSILCSNTYAANEFGLQTSTIQHAGVENVHDDNPKQTSPTLKLNRNIFRKTTAMAKEASMCGQRHNINVKRVLDWTA